MMPSSAPPMTDAKPTISEILPPTITRASTSRPKGSVPKGCAADVNGAIRREARSMDSPPSGNSQPDVSTSRIMTPVRMAPSTNSSER
ncbi:hypothetical protein D3C73_973150 [compost metagenome]